MQAYNDPARETGEHALPDVEVFHSSHYAGNVHQAMTPGWYWRSCFPGCLPDGDPPGPFDTKAEALADAQAA